MWLIMRNLRHFGLRYGGISPIASGSLNPKGSEASSQDLFHLLNVSSHAIPALQRLKEHHIPEITSIEFGGEPVEPPSSISWFPDQLAWQMTIPKGIIRRHPPFASFQKFLVSETSVGNISRQEAVSMIPPLVMDVKPGMIVLDLCAAPGSKAAQLIEMVHHGEESRLQTVLGKLKREQDGEADINDTNEVQEPDGAYSDDGRTTGLLIANDSDYRRAHMLIHQMKRLNSPNLIVTNHDATIFPSIKLPSEWVSEDGVARGRYLKFDRILADVPCSGDGTCRKNVNVWKDWNPGNALGLFQIQVRILVRALQMLKVGGRVVYSTCSMNPVENEAVVATAIERCGGVSTVDVIDCTEALPKLKRRPGLDAWKVMDKEGRIWGSWSEVEQHRAANGDEGLGRLAEAMFPPVGQVEKIPFERCMRVYPHLQDTGAFFITALQKRTEIKARLEVEEKRTEMPAVVEEMTPNPEADLAKVETPSVTEEMKPGLEVKKKTDEPSTAEEVVDINTGLQTEETAADPSSTEEVLEVKPGVQAEKEAEEPSSITDERPSKRMKTGNAKEAKNTLPPQKQSYQQQKKQKPSQPFEEPFKYLAPDHPELQVIYSFYNLSPKFPRDRFMVRNASGNPVKTIYYSSTLARDILSENEGKGIKFVHCGIKMFVKQDVQKSGVCKWRIQSEGLPILEGWVGDTRAVRLTSRKTLHKLLIEMFPKVDNDGWRELGEIGERVRDMEMGCCVLHVQPSAGEDGFTERLVIPLWRSLHSLNLMLPKEERKAMLLSLYNDDSPLMDHSKERFAGATSKLEMGEPTSDDDDVGVGGKMELDEDIDGVVGYGEAGDEKMLEEDEPNRGVAVPATAATTIPAALSDAEQENDPA